MTTVHLDPLIYAKILEEIRDSEFRTPDEYVNFVLAELLGSSAQPTATDPADDEAVTRSLQKLGYM